MRCCRLNRCGGVERGFTLLEVLVALALIGIGFSTTFGVVSGVHRLEDRASAQNMAMLFARATLDEFLEAGALVESNEPGDAQFGGHAFSYRLTVRPFKIASQKGVGQEEPLVKLNQVEVEVFWDGVGAQQSYRLATLVSRRSSAVSAASATKPPLASAPAQPINRSPP